MKLLNLYNILELSGNVYFSSGINIFAAYWRCVSFMQLKQETSLKMCFSECAFAHDSKLLK